MSSSVLYNNVFQAKIGNVQNQADSSSVYSAGNWSFKDASAVTRFSIANDGSFAFGTLGSVSSAGAWTLGPTSGTNVVNHTINGYGNNVPLEIKDRASDIALIRISGTTNNVSIGHNGGVARFTGIYGQTRAGAITTYVDSNGYLGTSTSIREAKLNIQPLDSTLNWLKELKPCVYQYRKKVDGVFTNEAEDFVSTGLIYDEVVQVNPQLCFDTADGKPSGVEYTRLITPMLKAIQELSAKNDEQSSRIEALEARLAALEAK